MFDSFVQKEPTGAIERIVVRQLVRYSSWQYLRVGQPYFAKNAQEMREATTCPTAHQIERRVKRYWWGPGRNSRKRVP